MSSVLSRSRRRARAHRHSRGFTLVELIVALTAGLLVSTAAYALARNAMKAFQDESRIAGSQVSTALALSRINSDLQRAGYMSSADVENDPRICPSVDRDAAQLRALELREGGSNNGSSLDTKGYDINTGIDMPDAVVISGNMTSAEQFEYRGINGSVMSLAVNRGPTQRAFLDAGRSAAAFCQIFLPPVSATNTEPKRFVRVVEASGLETYLKVTACDPDLDGAGGLEKVSLTVEQANGAAVNTSGQTCGARPGGGLVNPVSIIRYRIGPLCTTAAACAPYAAVMAPTGPDSVTGEGNRVELLREEIHPDDVAAPFEVGATLNSQEVIAEFAVDLSFGVLVAAASTTTPSALELIPSDTADIDDVLPNRARGVRVRLSTRARVPDRDAASPSAAVTRWLVKDVQTKNRYARMRTLHSEVQLPNLSQVSW